MPARKPFVLLAATIASASLLLSSEAASAATCQGRCGSLGANGDVTTPPTTSTYGWVSTFGGIDGVGQLPGVGGTDGSVFTTSAFTANAGDLLKYDFNFVTSDGQALPGQFIYEDYAWVKLVNLDTSSSIMLFDARAEPNGLEVPGAGLPPIDPGVTLTPATAQILAGSGVDGNQAGGPVWAPLGSYSGWCWGAGCGYTGWIHSTYTMASGGAYQLQFGVTNWGDTIYDTGLAYSGINAGGHDIGDDVPEPGVWTLMVLGLGVAGGLLRAQRRKLRPA